MKLLSIAPLFLVLAVAGPSDCSQDLSPTTKQALCNVLVGPIRYNTYNAKSGRYSGPVLALDLKQRNQIGQRLGCPLYRASGASG
jgi:hypothetical protein